MPPEATTTKDGAAAPESPGDERAPASGADADLGVDAELARYVSATRVAIPDEKSAELRRSIDRRVLAVMMATYFLQAMDKGTLPFASIMGLIDDTGLRGQQYNWLSTCLFLAILAAEYPQSFLLARVPVAKYLGLSIAAWGAALACTAACTGFAALVAVRALLGLFESVCQPAFILVTATWYRRDEQASRLYCWSLVATVGLMTIPPSSPARRAALLACYYAAYSFWPVQPMSVSLLSRNVAGQTKKTVAVAANMVAWAAGNSVGAQLFFSWDAPRYPVAFAVHLGCYGLLAAAMVSLRWHLLRQNRARDRRAGPRAPESCREQMLHAWGDLTDRENPNFRYVF